MSLAAWIPSSLRFFSISFDLAMAARSSADDVHPIFLVVSLVIRLKNPMFAVYSCPGDRLEIELARVGVDVSRLLTLNRLKRNRLTLIADLRTEQKRVKE